MTEQGETDIDVVRVTVRIDIPRMLGLEVGELQHKLAEVVAEHPQATLSVSMTTPRATPPFLR